MLAWHTMKSLGKPRPCLIGPFPGDLVLSDMFVYGFSSHSKNFTHNETSPLPVKDWEFWPMLGTHGHWSVRLLSVQHLLWHGASVYNVHLRGPVTLMHTCCWAFGSGASLPVFFALGMSRLGFEHPTFCWRGESSNWLRHRHVASHCDG